MKLYKGKPFIVTIDRSTAERGYVLKTIDHNTGKIVTEGEPLKFLDFIAHYKFDPEWPHPRCKP